MKIIEIIKLMLASKRAILEDLETAQVDVENLTRALATEKQNKSLNHNEAQRYFSLWREEQSERIKLVEENASLKGRIAQLESNMRSAV